MLYGQPLRLPGDFLDHNTKIDYNAPDFVNDLRNIMEQLKPVVTSNHSNDQNYIQKELQTCTHIFLRDDTVRSPLKSPYDGPYKVIQRNDKNFVIKIHNGTKTVSIDRVKPAFIENDDQSIQPNQIQLSNNRSQSPNTQTQFSNDQTRSTSITRNAIETQNVKKTKNVKFNDKLEFQNNNSDNIIRTRSGRIVKKPQRFVHMAEQITCGGVCGDRLHSPK